MVGRNAKGAEDSGEEEEEEEEEEDNGGFAGARK